MDKNVKIPVILPFDCEPECLLSKTNCFIEWPLRKDSQDPEMETEQIEMETEQIEMKTNQIEMETEQIADLLPLYLAPGSYHQ